MICFVLFLCMLVFMLMLKAIVDSPWSFYIYSSRRFLSMAYIVAFMGFTFNMLE